MAELKILTGPLRGQIFGLEKGGWAKTLGRGAENVDFRIPDAAISRRHAEFSYRDGQWAVRDLGSSNGTFINEIRIREISLLRHEDQIRCGSTVLLFSNPEPVDRRSGRSEENSTSRIELEYDPGETMVAVAFDSLQSKQTARQRRRMMEAGQAALNLSHGIKNILQTLRSGQDVMDDAFQYRDIEQARKAWNILKRNLERVQKLVLDMLKFSRDETPHLQPCQFNRLIESVVEALRPQADERQVSILTQYDEHLELVWMDPEQMQDVVMNLLLNAMEAVPPQRGQVVVRTELDASGQVTLQVIDNGPGIENVSIIFEPFYSTKPNVGAGLGLTIARKIVRMHGGSLEVQSLLGEGSIFTVRIPAGPHQS